MAVASDAQSDDFFLFRVAVACGLFASVGTTLAWIVWFAVQVRDPEILITVMVGAAFGFLVHWFQHYIHLALHEREHGKAEKQEADPSLGARARTLASLTWATAFGILTLACEHLIAHVAALYLQPVLASLATMLPAGIILGVSLQMGNREEGLLQTIFSGILLGLSIALTTALIWWIGWGTAPMGPLVAWWCIIGAFTRLATSKKPNEFHWWQPMKAVIFSLVFVVVMTLIPENFQLPDFFGPVRGWVVGMKIAAIEVVESPGLPANFWLNASKAFDKEHPELVPKPVVTEAPEPIPHVLAPLGVEVQDLVKPQPEDPTPYRKVLMSELSQGMSSDMVRSWVILLVFALCVGMAPGQEKRLRPSNYPLSETRSKDVSIAAALVLAVILTCLAARMSGGTVTQDISKPEATQEKE